MKKFFIFVLFLASVSSTVYGLQFSFGVNTLGLGPTFQRGDSYKKT